MRVLATFVTAVSGLNAVVGRAFSWLALVTVLACFWVVVQRYVFSVTQLWLQDLYVWLGGAMFMAVAGFAFMRDDHVRVDIFYRPATPRSKAIRDLVGVVLFLIPYCVVTWIYAFPYVRRSWALLEPSINPGGMPGLFILKTFILVFVVLVGLQGVAMAFRSILVLAGREELLPPQYRYPSN